MEWEWEWDVPDENLHNQYDFSTLPIVVQEHCRAFRLCWHWQQILHDRVRMIQSFSLYESILQPNSTAFLSKRLPKSRLYRLTSKHYQHGLRCDFILYLACIFLDLAKCLLSIRSYTELNCTAYFAVEINIYLKIMAMIYLFILSFFLLHELAGITAQYFVSLPNKSQ